MTEKRFTVPIKYRFSHSKIQLNGEPLTNDELVRILNTNDGAFVENFALKEENEQLKAQLYCDSNEGVCIICKHHYVEKTNMFYISKCEKGHEKCSKESVRHCEDFKLKELKE